jgi:hypothetical protein
MDVYLVPVGADRYELYCEVPDDSPEPSEKVPQGFVRRLIQRFRDMVADAERERRQGTTDTAALSWSARLRAKTMRRVAESIAEQRLLWHLRSQTAACLHFPDDLTELAAAAELRQQLGRDFEKHRFWLAIDAVVFVSSGVLILVPGPNLLAYFFAFRLVGHFFSLRGAKKGLNGVLWRYQPSEPLTELRCVLALEPAVRVGRVDAVARMLRLEHLVSFFERSAVST